MPLTIPGQMKYGRAPPKRQGTQTIGQAFARIEQSIGAMIISKISDKLFDKLGELFTTLLPEALKSALGLGPHVSRRLQRRSASFKQGVLRIFEPCAKIGEHETCRGLSGL